MLHMLGLYTGLGWIFIPVFLYFVFKDYSRIFIKNSKRIQSHGSIHPNEAKKPSIEAEIYRIAKKYKGVLTVSDLVIETGVDSKNAEQILQNLCDSIRIRMEIRDNGSIIYEFPEIMERV